MSYIKANIISDYDNFNNEQLVNVEQLQSVTQYATNVTVVEAQSINVAMNVNLLTNTNILFENRLIELQSIHSRSNDFNWSALDDPSEMNYNPNRCFYCFLFLIPQCWPCIPGLYSNDKAVRRSQKLKITDTHIDYEHDARSCPFCCFSFHKVNYNISLSDIWLIRNNPKWQRLDLLYSKDGKENFQVSLVGIIESSNTPKLIKDAIIQRRPGKAQTKRYTIPNITSTHKSETLSLISENASIVYKNETAGSDIVAFVDGLGDIYKSGGGWFNEPSRLHFWSPPVGRPRACSRDGPTMIVSFPDKNSCVAFGTVAIASRNSFK